MIRISNTVRIPESSIVISPIRSSGPGGQHVNKVATGVHLRFDIEASGLPQAYKERLAAMKDRRITDGGLIVIKAQRYKSQEKNRTDALERLMELLRSAGRQPKRRRATRPTRAARERRLAAKSRRAGIKSLRRKVDLKNHSKY